MSKYTTSERGFKVVDINTFEIVQDEPDIFSSTEANIAGIYGNAFVVVEHRKIALFDTQTLRLLRRFDFPTGYRFFWQAFLNGDKLYDSDEHGIYYCLLSGCG